MAQVRQRQPAPLLMVVMSFALCIAVPAYVITGTGGGSRQLEPLWPLLLTTLFGLRYAWVMSCGRVALFEMSVWLYSYIFMGLAPLVQLRDKAVLDTTPNIDVTMVGTATLVVLIGSLSLIAGSAIAARPMNDSGGSARRSLGQGIDPLRARLMCVFSWVMTAYALSLQGGAASLLMSRFEVDAKSAGVGNSTARVIIGSTATMSTLVAAVAMVTLVRGLPAQRRRWYDVALAALQSAVVLVTINPISSARYVFGTAFLALIGAYGIYEGLRKFRVVAAMALVAFLVVFPILDSFRVSTNAGIEEVQPLKSMLSGDFDSFYQVVNTVQYVTELGTTHGRQLLGVLLFAVPRTVWPDKPVDTGVEIALFKGYSFTNLSAPLWSEMFINGGWVFLVLSMTLIGILLRRMDDAMDQRVRGRLPLTPLELTLPFYMLILMRGSLLQASANLVVIVAIFYGVRRLGWWDRLMDFLSPGQRDRFRATR